MGHPLPSTSRVESCFDIVEARLLLLTCLDEERDELMTFFFFLGRAGPPGFVYGVYCARLQLAWGTRNLKQAALCSLGKNFIFHAELVVFPTYSSKSLTYAVFEM